MSIQAVTFSQVVCDSCGTHRDCVEPDSTAARIGASRDGWKYVAWDLKGKGLMKRRPDPVSGGFTMDAVPRQWDCCPDCPLPESPVEAAKIRQGRMTRDGRHGKWVDKESA